MTFQRAFALINYHLYSAVYFHNVTDHWDRLRWSYSLLSSGWVSSAPTLPSTAGSVFRGTGTNREVSGGFGEELFDETCLLQTPEPAWCCLCKTPEGTWQLPAVILAVRGLMWRWSRENKYMHRFSDITATRLDPGYWLLLRGNKKNYRYYRSMLFGRWRCVDYTPFTSPEDGQHCSLPADTTWDRTSRYVAAHKSACL